MKKIIFIAAASVFCANVFAQATTTQACNGTTYVETYAYVANAGTTFAQQNFNARCSRNVNLYFQETAVKAGAAASSIKGRNIYSSGSGGGSMTSTACSGACTSAATSTEAGTAFTNTSS